MPQAEVEVAPGLTVEERRKRLEEALARFEACPSLAMRQEVLEPALPWQGTRRCLPFWVEEAQRRRLSRWYQPFRTEPGRALGVVAESRGRAFLVWVECRIAPAEGAGRTPPAALWAEAVESLWAGAAAALRLYPHIWPIAPARDLAFRILDLDGEQLELGQERIRGQSLGLAAAVATWSALADRAPQFGQAFTGLVEGAGAAVDARVREVQELPAKGREARAAGQVLHASAESVPACGAAGADLAPVERVGQALLAAFGEGFDAPRTCREPPNYDLALALEKLDLTYRSLRDGTRWERLGASFLHLAEAPRLPARWRPLALARAGACFGHKAKTLLSLSLLRRAIALLPDLEHEVEGEVEVQARTHLANGLRADYDLPAAAEEAEAAWRLAERLRLRKDAVNARSTLGQILLGMGRTEEALPHLTAARDYYDAAQSTECPRNHCYVADALARSGRFEEARSEIALGRNHLEHASPRDRAFQERFFAHAFVGGLVRNLRHREDPTGWREVAATAAEVLGLPSPMEWPGPSLRRYAVAAAMRGPPAPDLPRLAAELRAEAGALPADKPLLAWHLVLGLGEMALVVARRGEPDLARALTREVSAAMPEVVWKRMGEAARAAVEAPVPALADAILHLLELEQY